MNNQSLISATGLSVRFGKEVVLQNFSFSIPEGKHTIIKGESGSGKSTLLKLILGFLQPAEGSIRCRNAEGTRQIRKQTAWLPQDLDLGTGTVEEVMQMPFTFAANRTGSPGRPVIISVMTKLGLSESDLAKSYRSLSTGQRQRVGLAVCHLLDKPIMLLDEPTSALDSVSKKRAEHTLLAHTNKTVISTSHDPFWLDTADNLITLP